MSFALTTQQVLEETKDVTRRLGWAKMKPGELFWAVEKGMGLKPGEKIKRLKLCRCKSNRPERLNAITSFDVSREGFFYMTAGDFVKMFCRHMKVQPDQIVNRIEFEYVKSTGACGRICADTNCAFTPIFTKQIWLIPTASMHH